MDWSERDERSLTGVSINTQSLKLVRTSMSQGDRSVLWLAKDIQVCPEASKEELL